MSRKTQMDSLRDEQRFHKLLINELSTVISKQITRTSLLERKIDELHILRKQDRQFSGF